MTAEERFPFPKRQRRSQAERSADTRQRVIDAVVESIAEIGYRQTTGTEIARRAGVSWGAVQHQFGDKNGVLAAALDEGFDRLVEVLQKPSDPSSRLETRVDEFVDRAWQHFSSRYYRTAHDIFLDLPPELEALDAEMTRRQTSTWSSIWKAYFFDSSLTRRETTDLMVYSVVVLSGLATTAAFGDRDKRRIKTALGFLKETLTQHLSS